jgi:broad specificity phosphatase PhoE
MTEKHVYFVRHAQSNANAIETDLGEYSVLSELGRQQAVCIANRLQHTAHLGVVLTSSFPRAAQTAAIIGECAKVPVELSELFIQRRRPSCVLGKKHSDIKVREVMEQVFTGYGAPGHRHSDEENLDDLRGRTQDALDFLVGHPQERLCVVTHGMFLRALLCAALVGPEFPGSLFQNAIDCLEPENTGVTYLRYEQIPRLRLNDAGYRWRMIFWNDSSHLSRLW